MLRPRAPRLILLVIPLMLAACGVPPEEVDSLRRDVVRLRAETRDARKEAGRAREEIAALNLKAEVHAFLQNDPALKSDGHFPALANRIGRNSRGFTFALTSAKGSKPRALYFKTDQVLEVDFVAGSGVGAELGNRLEIFTRNESFVPLSMQATEYNAYVLEEGTALKLRTRVPTGSRAGPDDAAEVLFRYLPEGGADRRRLAYVRVLFLGLAADEGGESEDGADEGDGESQGDDATMDFSEGAEQE